MLTQTDIIEMAEEDRAYQRVKELVDLVEPYDLSGLSEEVIDKINSIGCTSFMCKFVKDKDDNKIYVIPLGEDKPIKIIYESEETDKLYEEVDNLKIGTWTI